MCPNTCSVNGRSLQGEVLHQDGGSLVDEDIHTLHMAFECGQVQRSMSLAVPHIQVKQGLHQHLHGLVVAVVGLREEEINTIICVSW